MKRLILGCFQGHRQEPSRREAIIAPVEAVNSGAAPSRNSEQLLQATSQYDIPLPVVSTVTVSETDALPQPPQSTRVSHASQPDTSTLPHTKHHRADTPSTPRPPDRLQTQPEPYAPRLSLDCGLGVWPPAHQPPESPFTAPLLTNLLSGSTTHDTVGSDIISLYSVISECSRDVLLRVRAGAAAPALLDLSPIPVDPTPAGPRQLASRVLRGRASLDALLLLGALVRAADEAGLAVPGPPPPGGPSRLERIESGDLPPTDELPLSGQGGLGQGPPGRHGAGAVQVDGLKHVAEAPSQQPQSAPQRYCGATRMGVDGCPLRHSVAVPSGGCGDGTGTDGDGGGDEGNTERGGRPAPEQPSWSSVAAWTSLAASARRAGSGGSILGDCGIPASETRAGGTSARDADFTFYPLNASGGGSDGATAGLHENPWVGRGVNMDSGILSVHQDSHQPRSNPYTAQHAPHPVGPVTTNAQFLELFMRLMTNASNTTADSELMSSAQTPNSAHIFSTANAVSGAPPPAHDRNSAGAATTTHSTSADGDGDSGIGVASQQRGAACSPSTSTTTSTRGGYQRCDVNTGVMTSCGGGGPVAPVSGSSSSLHPETYSTSTTANATATATCRSSAPLHRLHAGLVMGGRRNSCDAVPQTGPGALALAAAAAVAAAGFLCSSAGGAHSSRSRSRCGGGSASRFWGPGGGGGGFSGGGGGGGPGSFLSAGHEDSGPASLLLVGALSELHSGQGGTSLIRLPTGSGSIRDVLSRVQQQQLEVGGLPSSSTWSTHTGLASLFDAPLTAALRHNGAVRTFKRAVGGGGLSLSRGSTGTSPLTGSFATIGNSAHRAGSSTAAATAGLSHLGAAAAVTGPSLWLGSGLTRPPLRRATLSTVSSIRSNADAPPPAGAVPGRLTQPGGSSGTVRLTHMRLMPYCVSAGGGGGPPLGPPPPLTYDQLRWILERRTGSQTATSSMYGNDPAGGPSGSQPYGRRAIPADVSAMGLAPGPRRVCTNTGVAGTTPLMDLDEHAGTARRWHAEAHSTRRARGGSATHTGLALQTPYDTRQRGLALAAATDAIADELDGAGREAAALAAGSLGASWLRAHAQHGSSRRGPFGPRIRPAVVSELGGSSDFSRFSAETEWGPMGRGMEGDTFTLTSGTSFPRGPGRDLGSELSGGVE